MATDVSATGLRSFIWQTELVFGTGIILDVFYKDGILHNFIDMLTIEQKIEEISLEHNFKTLQDKWSGHEALHCLRFLK